MRQIPVAMWLFGSIFFLSLFLICFSVVQIFAEDSNIEKALEEWDAPVEYSTEDVIEVDLVVSEQVTNKKTDHDKKSIDSNEVNYTSIPAKGDIFGKIIIPKLDKELPIIHGTSQAELAKGVGHYIGSVLPGKGDNSVLAGHRDTVFKDLDKLELGDHVIVETSAGSFTYEVSDIFIVESDDRTVIVPHDEAVLTLVTCYPFNFIGAAPQRYIITAKLVQKTARVVFYLFTAS
jgi:sortase A